MGQGRPSSFTQEVADVICHRLSEGKSLRQICAEDASLPHRATVIHWRNTIAAFNDQYARARDAQADCWAEQILEIADDATKDWINSESDDGDGKRVTRETALNHEHVTRARLRVDSRKWLLSKLKPGTYGDKLQHANAAGDGDQRVEVVQYQWAPETPK